MWNLKTALTPVIIGKTGDISNSFRKFPRNTVGMDEIKELKRKTVILALQTYFGNY
jgi:hypothetical protein